MRLLLVLLALLSLFTGYCLVLVAFCWLLAVRWLRCLVQLAAGRCWLLLAFVGCSRGPCCSMCFCCCCFCCYCCCCSCCCIQRQVQVQLNHNNKQQAPHQELHHFQHQHEHGQCMGCLASGGDNDNRHHHKFLLEFIKATLAMSPSGVDCRLDQRTPKLRHKIHLVIFVTYLDQSWTHQLRCSVNEPKQKNGTALGNGYRGLLLFADNCWILAMSPGKLQTMARACNELLHKTV